MASHTGVPFVGGQRSNQGAPDGAGRRWAGGRPGGQGCLQGPPVPVPSPPSAGEATQAPSSVPQGDTQVRGRCPGGRFS